MTTDCKTDDSDALLAADNSPTASVLFIDSYKQRSCVRLSKSITLNRPIVMTSVFTLDAGVTLTINQQPYKAPKNWFTGGTVKFGPGVTDVHVEWFQPTKDITTEQAYRLAQAACLPGAPDATIVLKGR